MTLAHRCSTLALAILGIAAPAMASTPVEQPTMIPLYATPKGHPEGMHEKSEKGLDGHVIVRNVTDPTIEVYLPAPNCPRGPSVIVAPGGGFMMLSWEAEGTLVAQRLAAQCITAFVLKYRLEQTPEDLPTFIGAITQRIQAYVQNRAKGVSEKDQESVFPTAALAIEDAGEAVRLVRSQAGKWGLDPKKVGFLGFSAGGITATAVASGEPSARPDFIGVIYGNIPLPVPSDAPPAFIATAADDPLQGTAQAVNIFNAWKAAKRQAELHIYDHGGHGFGLVPKGSSSDRWFEEFVWWMQSMGVVKATAP